MTNAELKKGLLKAGASAEDVKKIAETYDAEKITAIVEKAASVKEAAEEIQKLYPAISAKELQKQYHFYEEQLTGTKKKSGAKKSVLKLTENELEHVAGGSSVGDWFSNNWKKIVIGLAIAVGCAALGALGGQLWAVASQGAQFGIGYTGMLTLHGISSLSITNVGAGGLFAGAVAGGAVGGAVAGGVLGSGAWNPDEN